MLIIFHSFIQLLTIFQFDEVLLSLSPSFLDCLWGLQLFLVILRWIQNLRKIFQRRVDFVNLVSEFKNKHYVFVAFIILFLHKPLKAFFKLIAFHFQNQTSFDQFSCWIFHRRRFQTFNSHFLVVSLTFCVSDIFMYFFSADLTHNVVLILNRQDNC